MTDAPADVGTIKRDDLLTEGVLRNFVPASQLPTIQEVINHLIKMIREACEVESHPSCTMLRNATILSHEGFETLTVGDFVTLTANPSITRSGFGIMQSICMEHLRVDLQEALHAGMQPDTTQPPLPCE